MTEGMLQQLMGLQGEDTLRNLTAASGGIIVADINGTASSDRCAFAAAAAAVLSW
jgi:hypothetical protein